MIDLRHLNKMFLSSSHASLNKQGQITFAVLPFVN
jgi:hypothetical protein